MSKKQEEFRKNYRIKSNILKGIAVAAAMGTIGTTAYESNPERAKEELAKYANSSNKMLDYLNINDKNMLMELQEMEKNVGIYNSLSEKSSLSKEEKIKLDNAKDSIKEQIMSDDLSEFYLENVFKSKIKSAYSAEYVKVQYDVNNMAEEFMVIDVYEIKPKSNLDKPDIIVKQHEMPREVKAAIGCIVDFQEFAECSRDQIGDKSIEKAAKDFESMKGFANMELTRNEKGNMEVKKPEKEIER